MAKFREPKPGYVRIFRTGYRHWKTGRWIETGRPIPMDIPIDKLK